MRKRRDYVTIKADTVRTILKILIKSSHKKIGLGNKPYM